VAGLNLAWGTYQFVYNIVRLRQRLEMSRVGALLNVSVALLHLCLWFIVCSLYMGISDEPDLNVLEQELSRQEYNTKQG
jgi:hypothetical protein